MRLVLIGPPGCGKGTQAARVADGCHVPHISTGEILRLRGSVAGFDVTFSAPKSVSVLFGIGDATMQSAIHDAHARAVTEAFSYFERSTAFARRGAGGAETVRGDGLVAAAFVHRTSRSGDHSTLGESTSPLAGLGLHEDC